MVDYLGQTFGNYQVVERVGTGAFATVYRAKHKELETNAAIKVLDMDRTDASILEQFYREAKTIAQLIHPKIVRVLDFGVEQDTPYLVMEYAPEGSLRKRHPEGRQVLLETVISYVWQIAEALDFAHAKGVIHSDVKPENILVREGDQLLLSDFGLAVVLPDGHSGLLTTQEGIAGTPYYMAPEQIKGKPHQASDQYALGIVVYEWLTGIQPFEGEILRDGVFNRHLHTPPPALREHLPTIPPAVESVVLKALAKDPQQRFANVQAFATALEQASQTKQRQSVTFSEGTDQQTLPKASIAPSDRQPSLPPPSVSPSSARIAIPVSQVTQPASPREVTNLTNQQASLMTPMGPPSSSPLSPQLTTTNHRSGLSRIRAGMLIGLVFVVIVGSVGLLYTSVNNHIFSTHATATAVVRAYNTATTNGVMDGFDPQHTHFNPYEKVLNPANVSRLVPYWTVSANVPPNAIDCSPAVTDGVVYVCSNNSKLNALDASTGKILWAASLGSPISTPSPTSTSTPSPIPTTTTVSPPPPSSTPSISTPSISPTRISSTAIINATPVATSTVTAVTAVCPQNSDPAVNLYTSSPAVANGVVYVSDSEASNLQAFDTITGRPRWTTSTGGFTNSSPTVANGIVYVGTFCNGLQAFDTITGKPRWTAPIDSSVSSSPAVANGIVYVGTYYGVLYAFDATTGELRWMVPTGDVIETSPAVANGIVYVSLDSQQLLAFNASTGAALWTARTGGRLLSSPAVANGVVYIGSSDGKLYAFDASTGKSLWSASTGLLIAYSSPAVANGVVYIGSSDGKLYAFDASTGKSLWSASIGNSIAYSSPAVANGVVYIGSSDGKLYAFHLPETMP